MKKSKVYW